MTTSPTSTVEWTSSDSHDALYSEGWDIFDIGSHNDTTESFQIQLWNDFEEQTKKKRPFETESDWSDHLAWRHVLLSARDGSALHKRALAFIKARAPLEHERIMVCAAENGWLA